MKRPSAPNILTAEDPVGAFESAIPLLVEILPDKCSSSDLVRDILWSTYNGHPVSLNRLHILDQDRKTQFSPSSTSAWTLTAVPRNG